MSGNDCWNSVCFSSSEVTLDKIIRASFIHSTLFAVDQYSSKKNTWKRERDRKKNNQKTSISKKQHTNNMQVEWPVWYFLVRLGRRGNLFADLSLVVIERSRGLGRRLERQDEGSSIDLIWFCVDMGERRQAKPGRSEWLRDGRAIVGYRQPGHHQTLQHRGRGQSRVHVHVMTAAVFNCEETREVFL